MTRQIQSAASPRLAAATSALAGALLALIAAPAQAATLPDSERLDPVRPALARTLDQAERDGLPTDVLVSKVREGLAKGVSADAIRAAVERLARGLDEASHAVRAQSKRPATPLLVRTLADARLAGVDLALTAPLLASRADEPALVRAIEALTELSLRGYPSRRATQVVDEVLARDPSSVGRVVSGVEAIRIGQTVSRADALESLGRNIASSGGSFDTALSRSLEGSEHGNAGGNGRGQSADHLNAAAAKKGAGPKR